MYSLNAVFHSFGALYKSYSSPKIKTDAEVQELGEAIDHWVDFARDILSPEVMKCVYMHLLEAHAVECINTTDFRSLGFCSSHSVERKNGMQSTVFFQSTMKGGGKWNKCDGLTPSAYVLRELFMRELAITFHKELQ